MAEEWWLCALWYASEPVHGLATHFSGCTVGPYRIPEDRDSCVGLLLREWRACVYVCMCVWREGGACLSDTKGQIWDGPIPANQCITLHLTAVGPEQLTPHSQEKSYHIAPHFKQTTSAMRISKDLSTDLWWSMNARIREDLRLLKKKTLRSPS